MAGRKFLNLTVRSNITACCPHRQNLPGEVRTDPQKCQRAVSEPKHACRDWHNCAKLAKSLASCDLLHQCMRPRRTGIPARCFVILSFCHLVVVARRARVPVLQSQRRRGCLLLAGISDVEHVSNVLVPATLETCPTTLRLRRATGLRDVLTSNL
jgi:hypothetical protein